MDEFTIKLTVYMRACWYVLSSTRKETRYNDQTGDLFNILPTKLEYTS